MIVRLLVATLHVGMTGKQNGSYSVDHGIARSRYYSLTSS